MQGSLSTSGRVKDHHLITWHDHELSMYPAITYLVFVVCTSLDRILKQTGFSLLSQSDNSYYDPTRINNMFYCTRRITWYVQYHMTSPSYNTNNWRLGHNVPTRNPACSNLNPAILSLNMHVMLRTLKLQGREHLSWEL
jgi:hypothetical protein